MASVTEVKQLEVKIKEDVKHINELPKIVQLLQHSDKAVAQAAMQSMRRVLFFFLEKGDLRPKQTEQHTTKKAKSANSEAIDTFQRWLWDIYVSYIQEMLHWLGNAEADSNLRVGALRSLMEFVPREGDIRGCSGPTFGNETFHRVVHELANTERLTGELTSVLKGEYIGAYMDVQYFMLKNLAQILDSQNDKETELVLVANALRMLDMVNMPHDPEDISSFLVVPKDSNLLEQDQVSSDEESDDEILETTAASGEKRKAGPDLDAKKASKAKGLYNIKQHRNAFSLAWIAVLRHKLPEKLYKKVLAKLPDEVIPHLVNPLLLADFLTDSYSIGGVTSLLALNSLFILIQDYNFDSPDFYNRLYALLDNRFLYSAKQRNRFFELLNLFLSSTHLPAYTIAAFAKRLSRGALTAEPGVILFIIPMVYNLILRHKECLQLIHRTGAFTAAEKAAKRRQELSSNSAVDAAANKLIDNKTELAHKDGHDPFNNDATDPVNSNALQSSLWELHTMKRHFNADVALKARMFEEKLRHQLVDVRESMDITYKSIFDKQLKRKVKGKAALTFQPCHALFSKANDESKAQEEETIFAKVFVL
ncbi:hypothetical protein CCR75_005696 [Bremia lactucae]|uniref:CCAAT-binding factor domain-containing protein n=1 Tax=Bremia lactucae TaxID=4779 RepID=A0A976FG59_BRELC|nr:hypothetical protein CCR75_005696 [Bremia lactucae]